MIQVNISAARVCNTLTVVAATDTTVYDYFNQEKEEGDDDDTSL